MSDSAPSLDVLGAVRRQWWIVALAAVAAVAMAFAAALAATPVYTAVTAVRVDAPAINRTFGAPTPDDVVRASSAELRQRIKAAGGFSASEVTQVRFATIGSPQTHIGITAKSATRAGAVRLANVAAQETVNYAHDSLAITIDTQAKQVAAAKAALAAMPPNASVFDRWSVQSGLIDSEGTLASVTNIYSWDGQTAVSAESRSSVGRSTLAAALLLGLFIGVVIGGVREYLFRRASERSAA